MAQHKSTINIALASSVGVPIKWSSFDSGANDMYFDVSNVDASKLLILIAGHSTIPSRWWIGTSDSRSSGAGGLGTKAYPYSAAKQGRMLLQTTLEVLAQPEGKFMSTVVADTEVWGIFALGPFETARFKDSDGRIHLTRGVTTAGGDSIGSEEQHACAILLP